MYAIAAGKAEAQRDRRHDPGRPDTRPRAARPDRGRRADDARHRGSRRTRRRVYRIADDFLAFWLSVVDSHRGAIERGLGRSVLPVMMRELDDHLGGPWEEAMRIHLRRLAAAGELGEDVVAVGRYWTAAAPPVEIDGVVLAGRSRKAVAVAEAKWARRLDGTAVVRTLARKGHGSPPGRRRPSLRRRRPRNGRGCGLPRCNGCRRLQLER